MNLQIEITEDQPDPWRMGMRAKVSPSSGEKVACIQCRLAHVTDPGERISSPFTDCGKFRRKQSRWACLGVGGGPERASPAQLLRSLSLPGTVLLFPYSLHLGTVPRHRVSGFGAPWQFVPVTGS